MKKLSRITLIATIAACASLSITSTFATPKANMFVNINCPYVTDPIGHNHSFIETGVNVKMSNSSLSNLYIQHSIQGKGEQCANKVFIGCDTNSGDPGLANCVNKDEQVSKVASCPGSTGKDLAHFHVSFSNATTIQQGDTIIQSDDVILPGQQKGSWAFSFLGSKKLIYKTDTDGNLIYVQCPTIIATPK